MRNRAPRVVLVAVVMAACDGSPATTDAPAPDAGPPTCAARPAEGVWATVRLPSPAGAPASVFRVSLTRPQAIERALDAWRRQTSPTIPHGMLRCRAPVGWNCGWSWHLDPATTTLVEVAIELCDGPPPADDLSCEAFVAGTGGWWCPWGAELIELRDCRTLPSCPVVAR